MSLHKENNCYIFHLQSKSMQLNSQLAMATHIRMLVVRPPAIEEHAAEFADCYGYSHQAVSREAGIQPVFSTKKTNHHFQICPTEPVGDEFAFAAVAGEPKPDPLDPVAVAAAAPPPVRNRSSHPLGPLRKFLPGTRREQDGNWEGTGRELGRELGRNWTGTGRELDGELGGNLAGTGGNLAGTRGGNWRELGGNSAGTRRELGGNSAGTDAN